MVTAVAQDVEPLGSPLLIGAETDGQEEQPDGRVLAGIRSGSQAVGGQEPLADVVRGVVGNVMSHRLRLDVHELGAAEVGTLI